MQQNKLLFYTASSLSRTLNKAKIISLLTPIYPIAIFLYEVCYIQENDSLFFLPPAVQAFFFASGLLPMAAVHIVSRNYVVNIYSLKNSNNIILEKLTLLNRKRQTEVDWTLLKGYRSRIFPENVAIFDNNTGKVKEKFIIELGLLERNPVKIGKKIVDQVLLRNEGDNKV